MKISTGNPLGGSIDPTEAVANCIAGTGSTLLTSAGDLPASDEKPLTYTLLAVIGTISAPAGASAQLRIAYDYVNNNGGGTAYAKIYRNRSGTPTAVGTESSMGAGGWKGQVSEDLSGWINGDIVEIWGKCDAGVSVGMRTKDRTIKASAEFSPDHGVTAT